MAQASDFTPDEWEAMQKGVIGAGLFVSAGDSAKGSSAPGGGLLASIVRGGLFDTMKESRALLQHVANARRASSSELVREVAKVSGTGFGLGAAPAEIEAETLEALRTSVATLEAKAPEELEAYRAYVLDVAESVAGAAKGVESAEEDALARIRSALGARRAGWEG